MLDVIKNNPFIIGALSGSLASYLLGLLVSYWRREKRWLGYAVTSRNIVQAGSQKLALTYDGRPTLRLDSHTVLFRNIGNRPLSALPVKVQCTGGGLILDHELKLPDGASFASTAESEHITVTIDLLNPGETFSVGLTVADSSGTGGVKAIARAEFLHLQQIGDQTNTLDILELLLPHVFMGRMVLDLYKISSRAKQKREEA